LQNHPRILYEIKSPISDIVGTEGSGDESIWVVVLWNLLFAGPMCK